jgi:hypothetical protein
MSSLKIDYDKQSVDFLRQLCNQRGIRDCTKDKKYIKRSDLIELLRSHDKEKFKKCDPQSSKKPLVVNESSNSPLNKQPLPKLFKPSRPGEPQRTEYPIPPSILDSLKIIGAKPKTTPPRKEYVELVFEDRYNPTPKKAPRKEKRNYIEQPINLHLEPIQEEKPHQGEIVSITLQQFIREIETPIFIDNFVHSIKKLLVYKYKFYQEKYKSTKDEHTRVKDKISVLKMNGASEKSIDEMFPMKDLYVGFLIQLKEIIEKIGVRFKSIDKREVKENLKEAIEDPDLGFASIIGRENVKNSIASQLYAFSKNYKTFTNSFNNICFLGSAGTGKTAIAKVLSFVYSKCGILTFETTKIVSRADLVAGYVGHTAMKTRAVLMETLEGVLFIDEAYQLGVSPLDVEKKDFGPESITEIVNFLDKYIGMNVVIVAGYKRQMLQNFFPTNEGLSRRFPYKITLKDYTTGELTDILIQFMENKLGKDIGIEIANYLYSIISYLSKQNQNIFANQAGDMLNLGTSIVKVINSAYNVGWKNSISNDMPIIKQGFNDFLETKGYYIN